MIEFTDDYLLTHDTAFVAGFYPETAFGFYTTLYSDDIYCRDCIASLVAFDGFLMSLTSNRAEDMIWDSIDIGQGEEFELDFALSV